MSQTNTQKKKQQKKHSRRKSFEKVRNLERNQAPPRYRWDVLYDGDWILGFKSYRKWVQVEAKLEETEALRKNGVAIAAGRIVDLLVGKIVKEVAPSPAKPQGEGALPDKMADDPEAAQKGILGRVLPETEKVSES